MLPLGLLRRRSCTQGRCLFRCYDFVLLVVLKSGLFRIGYINKLCILNVWLKRKLRYCHMSKNIWHKYFYVRFTLIMFYSKFFLCRILMITVRLTYATLLLSDYFIMLDKHAWYHKKHWINYGITGMIIRKEESPYLCVLSETLRLKHHRCITTFLMYSICRIA